MTRLNARNFRTGLLASFAAVGLGCSMGCATVDSGDSNLTKATVESAQSASQFDAMMIELAQQVDAQIRMGVPVPVPVDAGGGYTHEQHKQNGKTIYEAGLLYTHTGNEKYVAAVRDILLEYADLYPTLNIHPKHKSSNEGRLFWQGLNEAVWLVYAVQGYGEVRDRLTEEQRQTIEDGVFNPMADFLSHGSADTFNRIHNHATWSSAGVGLTGYVLGQPERVNAALMGLSGTSETGFLKQLDLLFSPDGYYAEGPYYQRYALMPFIVFAQAIEQHDPDRKIFEYRDGVLLKAVRSTVQQSYARRFFPINDAIREKGLNTVELKYGLAIAYSQTKDPKLLGAAKLQNGVVPTQQGRFLLDALEAGKAEPFDFKTQLLRDGPGGKAGGLAILRSSHEEKEAAVVVKATSQGMGHGHFDKLGFQYYDNGAEIVADYGAARFLNVEPKNGGRYLPENTSWAKQSVAHNTLIVDETSHFGGDWRLGQQQSPQILSFSSSDDVDFVLAEDRDAYDDVVFQRFSAIVPVQGARPYVVDIVRAKSDRKHAYDLPVHFKGQLIETSYDLTSAVESLSPLGADNGYQHLWKRAASQEQLGLNNASWLLGDQFYSMTTAVTSPYEVVFAELGANDPNQNLRREQALITRTAGKHVDFVSVYERFGRYDSDEEVTVFGGPSVKVITSHQRDDFTHFEISARDGLSIHVLIADDASESAQHSASIEKQNINWSGPVHVKLTQSSKQLTTARSGDDE